jgi:putative endonuclease
MTEKKAIGDQGEAEAVNFLFANGYEVLKRNYRFGRAEIDIIARKDNELVFIEVKTRKNADFGHPESFVSEQQERRIRLAAEKFEKETNWQGEIRFDIIAIIWDSKEPVLDHFEDAF